MASRLRCLWVADRQRHPLDYPCRRTPRPAGPISGRLITAPRFVSGGFAPPSVIHSAHTFQI